MFSITDLLNNFGLVGILVMVFVETGLLIGFILPGDTLLFTAGMMTNSAQPFTTLPALMVGIPLAAIAGDQLGYTIGKRVGPRIMDSQVMDWIGPDAVEKTRSFFDRFGAGTVFIARFIAVVRTVTPVMAGFSGMNRKVFTLYSVLGSIAWGALIPLAGYYSGEIPVVQKYMHWFIIAGISMVLIPMLIQMTLLYRRSRSPQAQDSTPPTT